MKFFFSQFLSLGKSSIRTTVTTLINPFNPPAEAEAPRIGKGLVAV